MKNGIGPPVRRKEDARLLIGAGCFSDDVDLPRQARAFVLRSVHAHARIRSIDTTRAKALRACSRCSPAPIPGRRPQADPAGCLDLRADRGAAEAAGRGAGQSRRRDQPDAVLSAGGRQGPLRRRGGGARGGRDAGDREGRRRAGRDRLRGAAGGHRHRGGGGARRAASCGTTCRRISSSMPRSAMPRAPSAPSPAPRMSRGSRPGCSASPACRWRRAPRSATFDAQSGRYFLHAGSGGVVRQKGEIAAMLGVPPR